MFTFYYCVIMMTLTIEQFRFEKDKEDLKDRTAFLNGEDFLMLLDRRPHQGQDITAATDTNYGRFVNRDPRTGTIYELRLSFP